MDLIKVDIFVESRYKVNRKKIKATVLNLLAKQQIASAAEVSIAFVGDRKMRNLSKQFKGEDKTRNILSFSQTEGEPIKMKSSRLRLGDIVISYPEVIREAAAQEVLVDDKIDELVSHGLYHLLGIHHD